MPFVLHWIAGTQTTVDRVEGDALRIGRGTNAELRLDDDAVALEHAVLERDGALYALRDVGSVTGTYLNGKAVEESRIAPGDRIDVGGWRLTVGQPAPEGALVLEIRPIVAEPEPGAPEASLPAGVAASAAGAIGAPEIDFVAAYELRRPLLTKAALGLGAAAAAALLVLALPLLGKVTVFQPGGLAAKHASTAKTAASCTSCHAPWRGPVDRQCAECHADDGGQHHARQVATPPCTTCHAEHRGQARLDRAADLSCVSCHGALTVREGAPAFARRVVDFADDHPDFSPTIRGGASGQPPRRLPLAQAAAGADPARLKFGHRRHLDPKVKRDGAPLTCESCHRVADQSADRGTDIAPLTYETTCASAGCHPLTFDPRLPDEVAPHATPREVRDFLNSRYAENRDRALSLRDSRRTLLRRGRTAPRLDLGQRAARAVVDAELYLYRTACAECHEVDADATPFATVAPTGFQTGWLPHARFPHDDHPPKLVACADCHQAAPESAQTSDLLLPGIETCRGCHGDRAPAEKRVSAGCGDCHQYHPREAP